MTKKVLLDLGNVVLGVDFRRVFAYWAAAAGVPEAVFHERWAMDDAYQAHETGHMSFPDYAASLSQRFRIDLPTQVWLDGWNSIWTQPFSSVTALLPPVAARYDLYAFSNTNPAHVAQFNAQYDDALGHFVDVYTSCSLGRRKPDPAAFHSVCSRMQCEPADVIFLDDTAENVTGAASIGMDARHVGGNAAVARELATLL